MMARRIFPLLFAGAALAFTSMAGADQPADEVLYPRGPRETAAAPATAAAGGANPMLIGFALVAAAAGGWLLWRQHHAGTGKGEAPRHLSIAESKPLGNRQYLVVADYAGRKFLLGVCPGRIELLTPLGEDGPFEEER